MPKYHPSQIDDANLAYYCSAQATTYGIYYRLKLLNDQFPDGFYASERTPPQPSAGVTSRPRIHLSIVVYVGTPLDYQKYRHTALCLRPDNGTAPMIIHIVGPNMAYELQTRDDYEPSQSRNFAKEVDVGYIRNAMTKAQVAALVYQTPIDNSSREFNCQTWLGDALQRLANARYITQDECDGGVDKMVTATMEATEEPQ